MDEHPSENPTAIDSPVDTTSKTTSTTTENAHTPMHPPTIRIDELHVSLRRTGADGVEYELQCTRHVTAANTLALPVFEEWMHDGELVLRASGLCDGGFSASLDIEKTRIGTAVQARTGASSTAFLHFSIEFVVPLQSLGAWMQSASACASFSDPYASADSVRVGLVLTPGDRLLHLLRMRLRKMQQPGPQLTSVDLVDRTDSMLFDGPERHLFDLQNPEEGIWTGTGVWRLCLLGIWNNAPRDGFVFDEHATYVDHAHKRANDPSDLLWEDVPWRGTDAGNSEYGGSGADSENGGDAGNSENTEAPGVSSPGRVHKIAEFLFNSSHEQLDDVPPEGRDVALDITVKHALQVDETDYVLSWFVPMPLRVRNPAARLSQFKRLSAVGLDFGTTSTVAAYHHKGYRSLLRLGGYDGANSFENPTYLLIEDHAALWANMKQATSTHRFPNLLRIVKASHAARDEMAQSPNAVVGELKNLPERVVVLDQAPQLRDRQKQADFILDETKVRTLIRTYAYLLGRAINRPGQDVYLQYWLTHPAKVDKQSRALLEEELRAGILLSIPEGIPASDVVVSMRASEPEAFAAEVCPELAGHPAIAPLVEKHGELRFAVFDFGGGTVDIACGRFRPATETETQQSGAYTVIETLQVGGDDHLGGDYITHEFAWITHQYEKHLPEMQAKQVPMMRPTTVPPNTLSSMPFLYKRSLAGRQNMIRFERSLQLEQVKFRKANRPKRVDPLIAVALDGSAIEVTSLCTDVDGLHEALSTHFQQRIRDGVKLLASVLRNTDWGGQGDWTQQGVVILLAGNSSRSEYLEQVLGQELGLAGIKIWHPSSSGEFHQVVLYETMPKLERGVRTVGVSPKTAVALGALRIANREVHLVRRAHGFGYFLGDLKGFPPKFVPLISMGAPSCDAGEFGPHFVDFGPWDAQKPLRVCKDYEQGAMTGNDPRLFIVPTNLSAQGPGRLYACVTGPDEVALYFEQPNQPSAKTTINLAKYMD